jgi:hypothetical protein
MSESLAKTYGLFLERRVLKKLADQVRLFARQTGMDLIRKRVDYTEYAVLRC